jgi:uncharacterized protein YdiU (UPF0061 family)
MKLEKINFDNHFEKLGTDFFSKTLPTPLKNSRVISYSRAAARLIDLDEKEISSKKFLEAITAKKPHPKFSYLSQLYAGHQFGHLVPQLGDGRASLLTQIKNQKNESWDLVLKGCGKTPYSRFGDGKSVLRSAIREFLISETLFYLGIPTSRALCLIASDEIAVRETIEPAAQIIRMARSHIRFGTFEVFFYRKEFEKIKILADYVIAKNFPEVKNYEEFLRTVVESTAKLIAKWQAFGFCHGVLNTDNMSILGITFDYGPFGFLNEYNPQHICNHSDHEGRYSYANQPFIGFWDLHAFSVTLSHLISPEKQKEILEKYQEIFLHEYHNLMARKLGFSKANDDSNKLVYELLKLLEKYQIDYTFFFRNLVDEEMILELSKEISWYEKISSWVSSYKAALQKHNIKNIERKKIMNKINPKFILRNYLLQNAIEEAESGDFSEVKKLLKIMEKPFAEQKENEAYASLPPESEREIKISCSS